MTTASIPTSSLSAPRTRRRRTLSEQKRRSAWTRRWLALAGAATFVALWHIADVIEITNPNFFAGPVDTFRALREMFAAGDIWSDIWVTSQEFLLGIALAMAVGVIAGFLYGTSKLGAFMSPVVLGWNATPQIAIVPLLILWFGIGTSSKVVAVFLSCVTMFTLNTATGVRTLETKHVRLGRSFGASRLRMLTSVTFPHSLPFIVTGMRLAVGRGLIAVVVAELYASQAGLGNRLARASNNFATADVFAVVIVISCIGIALSTTVSLIEKRLAPWRS